MRFGKKIHLTVALAGLGALFLVVPAHAQQETNPDHFYTSRAETFPEATKAVPARHSNVMRLSRQSVKAKMAAANRRAASRRTPPAEKRKPVVVARRQ